MRSCSLTTDQQRSSLCCCLESILPRADFSAIRPGVEKVTGRALCTSRCLCRRKRSFLTSSKNKTHLEVRYLKREVRRRGGTITSSRLCCSRVESTAGGHDRFGSGVCTPETVHAPGIYLPVFPFAELSSVMDQNTEIQWRETTRSLAFPRRPSPTRQLRPPSLSIVKCILCR